VEIKFREKDILKSIHRIDASIAGLKANGNPTAEEAAEIEKTVAERVLVLKPIYHQVAVHFADLHDTPKCMLSKGVIQDIVPWKKSRNTLYWRLKRRLLQNQIQKVITKSNDAIQDDVAYEMLRRWFVEDKGTTAVSVFSVSVSRWCLLSVSCSRTCGTTTRPWCNGCPASWTTPTAPWWPTR